MLTPPGRRLLLGLAAVALAAGPAAAQAPDPARPVTLIVPFTEGGPTDTVARLVAPAMSGVLGRPIRVRNVTGAGGTTAVAEAASARPDGDTLVIGTTGTHGAAPALARGLRYDPVRSFDAIGLVSSTPIVLAARKDFPAKDLKGFVAAIRSKGAAIHQAQAGTGSVAHSAGVLLTSLTGAEPTLVVYRGTGPAIRDLVAGRVDFMTDQVGNVAAQVQAGTIRAYAVAAHRRSPVLPGVPTTAEAGLPAYDVSAWIGLFAPKGLPGEIRARLAEALGRALDDDAVRARLGSLGAVVPVGAERGPEALAGLVESEVARWTPLLRAATEGETEDQ